MMRSLVRWVVPVGIVIGVGVGVIQMTGTAESAGYYNGFDVSNATIPKDKILSGGPGKDGIPAILNPKFVPAGRVEYLLDSDKVVGYVRNGIARAYPLRILVWHEIVNDSFAGDPVVVTYCPLCGTCMVFEGTVGGEPLSFGVSGLLYQSDVLMYDHQTDSLWSQLKMESVSGKYAGKKLKWLASEEMTWKAWKAKYPDGEVLSTRTGYRRAYGRTAYANYMRSDQVMFPVPQHRRELRNKEWVVGVILNGVAKAYPLSLLEDLGTETLHEEVGGVALSITYDLAGKQPKVKLGDSDEVVPHVSVYWFAWQGFYPETELYSATR